MIVKPKIDIASWKQWKPTKCWNCGRTNRQKPRDWNAWWIINRAHLSAGCGKMKKRVLDRKMANALCPICHEAQRHWRMSENQTTVVAGVEVRIITDANMIWLKQIRDPEFYDPQFIEWCWFGNPPDPEPIEGLNYER